MLKLTKEDQHFLRAVVSLSWLSSLVIVLAGLVVTGGAIAVFSFNHSAFRHELLNWEQSHASKTLSITGRSTKIVNPTLSNSWSVILIWAAVGFIIYLAAAAIVRTIIKVIEFQRQLDYIHANPYSMLKTVIEHLIMRLVAAFLLATLAVVFVYHTLPYVISASDNAASDLWSPHGLHYAALSFALVAVCTYAASVLLRLTLGRERVFSH